MRAGSRVGDYVSETNKPEKQDSPADLTGPVAELEAFIAQTEARGEPVPPEARVMLARLRELVAALRDLTDSFGGRPAAPTPESEREPDGG